MGRGCGAGEPAGTAPNLDAVISLDAATVLLQWATGGLMFTWVTTRHREVGLGYGWLMRGTFMVVAAGALACGLAFGSVPVRDAASAGVIVAAGVALVVSWVRRHAGVSGQRAEHDRRSARVASMTGIERSTTTVTGPGLDTAGTGRAERAERAEFPPALDLVAPAIGAIGLVAAGVDAGGSTWLSVARVLAGAALLGSITDAMLLGHWYLVQPGLPRRLLNELVRATMIVWPIEVGLLLVRPGMLQVLNGSIDDGWDGVLGWFWVACAATTIVLLFVTRAALRERAYSAVMAATGLLYLAILTAFGTDLVARAVLA
jgi:hypothetical protein